MGTKAETLIDEIRAYREFNCQKSYGRIYTRFKHVIKHLKYKYQEQYIQSELGDEDDIHSHVAETMWHAIVDKVDLNKTEKQIQSYVVGAMLLRIRQKLHRKVTRNVTRVSAYNDEIMLPGGRILELDQIRDINLQREKQHALRIQSIVESRIALEVMLRESSYVIIEDGMPKEYTVPLALLEKMISNPTQRAADLSRELGYSKVTVKKYLKNIQHILQTIGVNNVSDLISTTS